MLRNQTLIADNQQFTMVSGRWAITIPRRLCLHGIENVKYILYYVGH